MNPDNNNSSKNPSDESKQSSRAKTACGGLLDHPEKFPSAMYRGERVYFCTTACWQAFIQNPDPFMADRTSCRFDLAIRKILITSSSG